jgi:hypothetical protein
VLTLNGVISGLGGQVTLAAGPSEFATMPLTAGLDLAVPTTVDAQCQSGLALGVTSAPSRMTMIRVGSLAPA